MYYFVVLMTIMSVALEVILVMNFRWMQDMVERFSVVGVMLSLVISWLVGAAFGAAGMVIATAAITSTIITALIYRLRLIDKGRRVGQFLSTLFFVVFHPIKALKGGASR